VSQPKSRTILSGMALISALEKTSGQVKWMRSPDDAEPVMLTPAQAIPIVRAADYVGRANHGKVVSIREHKVELPKAEPSFWDDRGVRRFYVDQRSRPGEYFTSRLDGRLLWARPEDYPNDYPGDLSVPAEARNPEE